MNADKYISTGQGLLGNNMFAYCLNNPVDYVDSDGEMAAAGVLTWSLAAGSANAWNPGGWVILGAAVVATVVICTIPWDSVGRSISTAWNQIKSSVKAASVSRSISKAVSKAKEKIRKEKKRYDYWVAVYVDYGKDSGTKTSGTYIPTTPLSYSRAISYVRSGGSFFADSKKNAYRLALAAGSGRRPTMPEKHKDRNGSSLGFWLHYHIAGRDGGHIFYVQ